MDLFEYLYAKANFLVDSLKRCELYKKNLRDLDKYKKIGIFSEQVEPADLFNPWTYNVSFQ